MSSGIKRGATFYLVAASSHAEKMISIQSEVPAVFGDEQEAIDYATSEACCETGEADVILCTPIKVVRDTRVSIEDYPVAADDADKGETR